jgi:phosphatidylglycerol---prolipoprotein diacylglyceryl transferase
MLAHYVHNLSPNLITFTENVAVRWYGLAYVLGFYLCYLVVHQLAKKGLSELKPAEVENFITLTAMFGVVFGGRLGYMLFYVPGTFIREPWTVFMIMDGGMSAHGGIIGVALFLLWYARKHGYSWTGLGDTLVSGAPLGILTGRIANFINGELFGRVTSVPWAVKFPTEVHHSSFAQAVKFERFPQHSQEIMAFYEAHVGPREELVVMLNPRHPSQLYEALGEGLFLFLLLYWVRVKFPKLRHGIITAIFLIGYALVRSAMEGLRQPDSGAEPIFGLTKGQFLSLFLLLAGALFLLMGLLRGRREVDRG